MMNSVFCILVSFFIYLTSFGQTENKELNIIVNQKGINYKKPPMDIYWFMLSRQTECDRLFWFKDKFPTPLKGKLHYHHKRVDFVMKYDDFFVIALLDYHKGRNSELIILNNDYEIIEEYVFLGEKKNTYRIIKKKIKSGILTKTDFLKGIEEFEKTIPKADK